MVRIDRDSSLLASLGCAVFLGAALNGCASSGGDDDGASDCPGCGIARRSAILEPGLGPGTYEMIASFDQPSTIHDGCSLTVGEPNGDAAAEVTTDCKSFSFNLDQDGRVVQIVIATGVENANDPFDRASITIFEDGTKLFGALERFEPVTVPRDPGRPECGTCERYRATFAVP